MKITQTFGSTFSYMMRAKLRNFARRSVYRYAAGIMLITFGMHRANQSLSTLETLSRGALCFGALLLIVFLVYCIYSIVQSRRFPLRTVTFTETTITVLQGGNTTSCDWGWVISADESSAIISMLIQQSPRTEIYLPKNKLGETKFTTLRKWLIAHGKLPPDTNV